jgi:hypothetical protein
LKIFTSERAATTAAPFALRGHSRRPLCGLPLS